ncbi:hypothetical protein Bca52824_037189 [Brassica carinata]|uniref:Uncharacterized protein n=1 Tax=Brassica carinata TaxID=52824 RepID=A0A8X7S6V6_BRACI|nr:hypothetical protein Bca52824_037189 [Brassica carinata]
MEEKLGMIFSRRRILIPRWRLRLGLDSAKEGVLSSSMCRFGRFTATTHRRHRKFYYKDQSVAAAEWKRSSEPAGKDPCPCPIST